MLVIVCRLFFNYPLIVANNSWYVTFNNEEETQKAFLHLQNVGKTFNNKPVYVSLNKTPTHFNTLFF